MTRQDERDVTLSERARVSLPLLALWSGFAAVVIATGAGVATYFGMSNRIDSIGQTVTSIEREIGKIADRVETGPSRREFDLVVERLRLVESKVRSD